MKFSFSNICEICKHPKSEGNHSACSKKKQANRIALEKAKKPKKSKTYGNPRQLGNFLKTLGQ
jgi:hypothetical protein